MKELSGAVHKIAERNLLDMEYSFHIRRVHRAREKPATPPRVEPGEGGHSGTGVSPV